MSRPTAINPCVRDVCHVHATCVHTGPDQHTCTCNHGYSGDGRVCVPVDPCQSHMGGCSAASQRCIYDGPGTVRTRSREDVDTECPPGLWGTLANLSVLVLLQSHCECLPGFESIPSGSCVLKEACQPQSCHHNANCTTVGPATLR